MPRRQASVSHADISHQHFHIIANWIGFDKKTVSDSNNYKKMSAWCREMELKYNLQQVLRPRKFLPKEKCARFQDQIQGKWPLKMI